jgi:hypothetical protein
MNVENDVPVELCHAVIRQSGGRVADFVILVNREVEAIVRTHFRHDSWRIDDRLTSCEEHELPHFALCQLSLVSDFRLG